MKTTVFNLIILDESGSMEQMTNQTISGCNETLNIIRSNAKTHAETMNSFVEKVRSLGPNVRLGDLRCKN